MDHRLQHFERLEAATVSTEDHQEPQRQHLATAAASTARFVTFGRASFGARRGSPTRRGSDPLRVWHPLVMIDVWMSGKAIADCTRSSLNNATKTKERATRWTRCPASPTPSTTRLASRAQRRALRALYPTCAIPGCAVHYDRCKVHHIIWWRNGGRTDLDNLLPVCAHHHTKIHDHDWNLTLGPNNQLTIRFPDGTIHNTGPPKRHAA